MRRPPQNPLVSLAIPIHNGADTLIQVVESVLAQTHSNLELVISDNASTDSTEEISRDLLRADERIVYQRHPTNIGVVNNFMSAAGAARGTYVRWIGEGDSLEPTYISRTLEAFEEDARRLLVTTQIVYVDTDGVETLVRDFDPSGFSSPDPVERLSEMLRLMTTHFAALDPLYGMLRRDVVLMPRRNILREDEIFAARLALAGPWGHVPEPLARRHRYVRTGPALRRWLGVPPWQGQFRDVRQCGELSHWIAQSPLDSAQRRRAHVELMHMYLRRKRSRMQRGVVKLSDGLGAFARPGRGRRAGQALPGRSMPRPQGFLPPQGEAAVQPGRRGGTCVAAQPLGQGHGHR